MSSETVVKTVGKKLRYYFEVKRLEDGFDLSGVNQPQLDHPPLKSRPTLQYDGLHDRSLKHYFSVPEVKQKLTKLKPKYKGDNRETKVRRILDDYMYRYRFVHPTMPAWMYNNHPKTGPQLKPELIGFGVPLQSQKHKAVKGGWPQMRSVPTQVVTKGEAERLIGVATKILVATETVDRLQSRPQSSTSSRQSAPKPFETSKPLPSACTGSPDGPKPKKKRPSTAKYTWDIDGRRHRKVKAYDDSYLPDWAMKTQEKPKEAPPPKPRPKTPPEPKKSPRPLSAKYRNRPVINVPEPKGQEDVVVNSATQTADSTVGIQTEKKLLEEYEPMEDEVKDGPWAEYQIYVRTGDRVGASTKADVKVTLYGEKGRSKEFQLGDSSRYKVRFQRGKEDVFLLAAHHVGKLRKVRIGHDRPEMRYSWFLDGVSVSDMYEKRIYDFTYRGWISGQKSKNLDGKTYKYLPTEQDRGFVDALDDVKPLNTYKVGKDRRKKDDISTESEAPKEDKRSIVTTDGSQPDYRSDSDMSSVSTKSYSSDSTGSSATSSSSGPRQKSRKKTATPPRKTPSPKQRLQPVPPPPKDDFFDDKRGPTFSFPGQDTKTDQEAGGSDRVDILQGPTIHDAARLGNLERMRELLQQYPEMKEKPDETGWTPLHIAVQQGRLEIVKWLTASSINLNTETPTGYSALHIAAMQGHVNCIIVLAAMGAALTCRSVDRQTPLHLAAMNGHMECVKWLIANRASLETQDHLNRTALDLAEEYQHREVAAFIKKCIQESNNAGSSFAVIRTSNKGGLETIKEDSRSDASRDKSRSNNTRPGSSLGDSPGKGRGSNDTESSPAELQEKRRMYAEQHQKMEASGKSFLDSIRDDFY